MSNVNIITIQLFPSQTPELFKDYCMVNLEFLIQGQSYKQKAFKKEWLLFIKSKEANLLAMSIKNEVWDFFFFNLLVLILLLVFERERERERERRYFSLWVWEIMSSPIKNSQSKQMNSQYNQWSDIKLFFAFYIGKIIFIYWLIYWV